MSNDAIQPNSDTQTGEQDLGKLSDGYHTFDELYEFRLLYNAALFNEWAAQKKYKVHKSWHHADAPYEPIFGKGWFIVMAELPTGQISNHYPPEDWSLFQVPETIVAHAWDGHTAADVAERLRGMIESKEPRSAAGDDAKSAQTGTFEQTQANVYRMIKGAIFPGDAEKMAEELANWFIGILKNQEAQHQADTKRALVERAEEIKGLYQLSFTDLERDVRNRKYRAVVYLDEVLATLESEGGK